MISKFRQHHPLNQTSFRKGNPSANNYFSKSTMGTLEKTREICSELTIKVIERRQ